MTAVALAMIRFYQRAISVHTPPQCRYQPTCSHYGYAAIQRFGVLQGSWLAARRVVRCNPFSAGGYDPVPEQLGHRQVPGTPR